MTLELCGISSARSKFIINMYPERSGIFNSYLT
jgi:hypothetical protein